MRWSPVPLDTLLDVDSIIDYWAPRGMVVSRVDERGSEAARERAACSVHVRCGGGGVLNSRLSSASSTGARQVHRTPALRPFPDLTQPESAFPRYPAGGLDPNLIVR